MMMVEEVYEWLKSYKNDALQTKNMDPYSDWRAVK